nr:hypothetical protein [Tanacetum cinerariifolium]
MSYKEPPIPPTGVNRQEPVEVTTDMEPQNSDNIHPPTVQAEVQLDKPAEEPVVKSTSLTILTINRVSTLRTIMRRFLKQVGFFIKITNDLVYETPFRTTIVCSVQSFTRRAFFNRVKGI